MMVFKLLAAAAAVFTSSLGSNTTRAFSRRRSAAKGSDPATAQKTAAATAASKSQDWQRAAACWQEVINDSQATASADSFFQLSRAYRKSGDLEAAQQWVRRGRSEHPEHAKLAVLEAKIAGDRKEWNAALGLWRLVLAHHHAPEAVEAYLQLSGIEGKLGRLDAAEATIRQGRAKHPGDVRLAERYAAIAAERKDWRESIARWKEALALAGDRESAAIYAAAFHSYREAGIAAEGRALLREGLMRHPNNAKLLVQYAISDNSTHEPAARAPRGAAVTRPPPVEIVICAHNALGELEKCLDAIFRHTGSDYFLTVVDDNSAAPLRQFADGLAESRPWMRVLNNPSNLGYTKSANRGLAAARADWIVLLNSDTIVTRGWLDGLFECAGSDPAIRAVGPLSNAATMQSIPQVRDERKQLAVNKLPNGMSPDDMGEIVREVSERSFPRVAVLNGFCMLLHGPTIRNVGLFDEFRFPRGYGEENDLCLRLTQARHKLAIADHVYVLHAKTQSFSQGERRDLIRLADKNLRERWSGYSYDYIVDSVADLDAMVKLRERIRTRLVQR